MTKSTITREESVQAVFDLKVGYRLGFADIETLKRVARMALAAMDSEPVAEVCEDYAIRYISSGPAPKEGLHPGDKLYRHAQQPVVRPAPECGHQWRHGGANKLQNQKQCIKCGRVELDAQPAPVVPDAYVRDERGRMMLNGVCEPKIGFGAGWNACRAAMLQAGNSPVIPEGYVMVPKEPTEAMINAWLSEVANWRGHVAGYKAMLATAPQEVK